MSSSVTESYRTPLAGASAAPAFRVPKISRNGADSNDLFTCLPSCTCHASSSTDEASKTFHVFRHATSLKRKRSGNPMKNIIHKPSQCTPVLPVPWHPPRSPDVAERYFTVW